MSRIPDDLPRVDFNPFALPPPFGRTDNIPFSPTDAGAASRAGEVRLQGQTRRGQLESQLPAQTPDPAELARQQRELMLDLTQMALSKTEVGATGEANNRLFAQKCLRIFTGVAAISFGIHRSECDEFGESVKQY